MKINEAMDQLLESVMEAGREAQYFMVRRSDWIDCLARLRSEGVNGACDVLYRNLPIQFDTISDHFTVGIVDSMGVKSEI